MKDQQNHTVPTPIINDREATSLDELTKRYNKLIEPNKIAKLGSQAIQHIPEDIKTIARNIGLSITEQELYSQIMQILNSGFNALEEQAAKASISEKYILDKINQLPANYKLDSLDQICLVRSYDLEKIVSSHTSQHSLAAFLEGGGTGAFGFWGLPFNIVLSTFLYFRAVQSIAMFYGYNAKNDSAELVIASEVFSNALNPTNKGATNEVTGTIGKIMVMSQASLVKQTAAKSWTAMAERGGIPLLLAQMRALANRAAQKALEKAGAQGLEHSLFKGVFEQLGRKLTLKTVGKVVPILSGAIGALIDTAQMKKVLEYSDIFYQKRFILEKESNIHHIFGDDSLIIDVDFDTV